MLGAVGEDLFRAVLQGTPPGTVYGLVAIGFVLTYKTSGVFNLAFGAQAYVAAALYFKLRVESEWTILPAVVLAVFVMSPLLGLVLERLVFRHLRTASSVVKLVVTIGLSVAIPALFELFANFEAVAGRTPEGIVPEGATVFYDPFGVYAFSRNELAALAIAGVSALALFVVFRFTSFGLQMRAVVESPRMTELSGIRADRVSAAAWMLSSMFAGLAGVLIAPRFNTLASGDFFSIVLIAVAAAAVGRLVKLPLAVVGGLGMGILIAVLDTFLPRWTAERSWLVPLEENLTTALPFLVLFGVLVLWPAVRRNPEATDPLSGVDPPPALATSAGVGGSMRSRLIGAALLASIGAIIYTRADSVWLFLVTQALIYSIIYLSVTVITGFAGLISLCQGAFAAIGGFAVFQLATGLEMSVLVAAFLGAFIAAAVGALLSIPIVRLGGVWVAIATLAFAFFFDAVIVRLSWVSGGAGALLQGTAVPRPVVGPWDFADDRAFMVLALVFALVTGFLTVRIREGTTGRILHALRGSPVAAESIGVSPGRARLTAFAISGFLAGLGGALLAIHQENVNYATNFSPFAALFWLVLVVTMGARTVSGAAAAGGAFSLFDAVVLKGELVGWILRSEDRIPGIFPVSPKWRFVLFGLGTLQFVRHPEGVVAHTQSRIRRRARPDPTARAEPSDSPEEAEVAG